MYENSNNSFDGQTWDLGLSDQTDPFSTVQDFENLGSYDNNNNSSYNFGSIEDPTSFQFNNQQSLFNSYPDFNNNSLQNIFKYNPDTYNNQANKSGWGVGGVSDYLSKILDNKGLMTLVGSLFEGNQNKKQANSYQNIVAQQQYQQEAQRQAMMQRQDQQQQVVSPYDRPSSAVGGDTMRNTMQQQLMSALKDPYGQPIVKAQTDALMQAQARKDAQAGRRSNMATSMPALLASQASIAQNYIDRLQGPAGANINPNYPSLNNNVGNTSDQLRALLQASQYNTHGYQSPLFNALGFNSD